MKDLLNMVLSFTKKMFLSPGRLLGGNIKIDDKGIEYVSGLQRQLSILIDLCLMMFLFYFVGSFLNNFFTGSSDFMIKALEKYKLGITMTREEELLRNKYIYKALAMQFLQFICMIFYVGFFWRKYSATPGKLLFGLRVLDANTFERITYAQVCKRFFSFPLSILPIFLGILWSNFDKRRQAWHDKLSNTVVITYQSLKKYKS